MTIRLIHTTRTWMEGDEAEPQVEECRYGDVEAIVRWLKRPTHPYPMDYERWIDGELCTEDFAWDIIRDREVRHGVRGADAASQEALVEACRRMGLPVPEGSA